MSARLGIQLVFHVLEVFGEVSPHAGGVATVRTLVGPLPAVYHQMSLQVLLLKETLLTLCALVWPNVRMALHVTQKPTLFYCFSTDRASFYEVWVVPALVVFQLVRNFEVFVTDVTGMRAFVSVYRLHVLHKTALELENGSTQVTLVPHLVLTVNFLHVFLKTIL